MFAMNTAPVSACMCPNLDTPRQALEKSSSVFVGKVLSIEDAHPDPDRKLRSSADPVRITFDVTKVYKGPEGKTLNLTTETSSATCGYPFKVDSEYFVYANGEEGQLSTDICTKTKLLSKAQEDLEVFKKIQGQSSIFTPLGVLVGVVIVLSGTAALRVVKNRR